MRGIHFTSLLLCAILGCSTSKPFAKTFHSQKAPDLELKFDVARANEKEGQLAKAESGYRELCEAKPDVARHHQRLGVVLTRMGQRDAGIAELERARQLEPQNTGILNDLGYAHLQTGDSANAAKLFKKALELDPQSKRANNNLALALGYEGDLKESFRMFQNTLPEADALSNLGYVATQSGNKELAVKAYSRALTLEPDKQSAAEALTQIALLDRDIEQNQSIANDLNTLDDERINGPKVDETALFPRDRAASPKQPKVNVTSNSSNATKRSNNTVKKVAVSDEIPRKKSVTATTATNTSGKVLLSEREE